MKIDPVRETGANGTTFTVKKTAFCEHHSPPGAHHGTGGGDEVGGERLVGGRGSRGQRSYTQSSPSPSKKNDAKGQKKKGKKASGGRRSAVPVLLVPQIPSHRSDTHGVKDTLLRPSSW